MASALSYLQSFDNEILQGKTEQEMSAAIAIAFLEIDRDTYGTTANIAAACLAAHNLISESVSSSAAAAQTGGQQVVEKQDGKIRIKYSGAVSSSSSQSKPADKGLDKTEYGQRFMRYRDAVSCGY